MNNVTLTREPFKAPETPSTNAQYAVALAAGDPRYQMKKLDRAGFSRGAAQRNQAGINAAQEMAENIAGLYGQQLQDSTYASNANLRGQQAYEGYAQALGGLNQQNAYANQMAALQRQSMALNLLSGLLR